MLQIEHRRNGLVETVHPVSAVLMEGERRIWSIGPDFPSYWRSGCKAFQLLNSLQCLPIRELDWLKSEDLAIGASSHSAEADHVARVRRLLRHFHLKEEGLRCGSHWPMHEPSAHRLLRRRKKCSNIHSNCSGKHSFMLAAATAQGWDPNYLPLEHPLQQGNLRLLSDVCAEQPGVGVDGCGVPTFRFTLPAMARGFSSLARSMKTEGLLGRIGHAMHQHPQLISGSGRLDVAVVQASAEPLSVKIGAEALFCIALPARGQGLSIKVHSGNGDALSVAVFAILRELGIAVECPEQWTEVRNVVGRVVGERVAVWA